MQECSVQSLMFLNLFRLLAGKSSGIIEGFFFLSLYSTARHLRAIDGLSQSTCA